MCGICFICDFENCAQELDGQKELLSHSLLCNRGPDAHSRELVSINEKISALFEGCVLWLQGPEPTPQPLLDPLGNVLLWNGDILAGHQVSGDKSDTQYVSERLASGEQESILSFLEDIKGPWALVYFHRPSLRLYFGRDVFGRHSLLWQLPSPQHPRLMVTSVWQQCDELQEVPAYGLFIVDFSMITVDEGFRMNLVLWSHIKEESLSSLHKAVEVVKDVRLGSHFMQPLNMTLPSPAIIEQLKSLPPTLEQGNLETFSALLGNNIGNFLKVLTQAVQRRVDKCPPCCQNCTASPSHCHHPRIAVLFSGGLDSAVLALLLDACLPQEESIDLLNVAFSQKVCVNVKVGSKHKAKKQVDNVAPPSVSFEVPDRISGRECWQQLQQLRPHRNWNFVEIDVTEKELSLERERTIRHLVAPLASVLDDSIGCALWFAGRGQGSAKGLPYVSPSRVLLCGQGADEQLGGYSRHRGRFTTGGWLALLEEIEMEVARIHTRNLGRDNRILAHHGRAPRFPYLDEEVVSTLNEMPVWIKTNMLLGRGTGEKLLLRLVAATLGLSQAARLPKRAIQFGSRIAKLENHKEKGSDQCLRLKGDSSAQEVT
ncbi:asparagine synthetase domain-containing protein 1-like isoform X1 [Eriocheir sinensis]|uniref:asparagine synthetase domain-containing protein 1-like isoform X1 n=1 Tax=Eriocheir sinensis TaxID=95602 RepID=UPI0021C83E9E|nr:asparagine synthetase domain-containing protein 1-like isoform X1 [Eriocheir sinensis]XP_050716000.1 asparagine synthetase domain-containing protein 1-like isoform X1 [Eriocheir sinensis]